MEKDSTWARSAPSPTNWPRDAWNPPLTLVVFVGAIVVVFLGQFAYLIYAVRAGLVDPAHLMSAPVTQLLLLQFAGTLPVAFYFLGLVPRLAKTSLRDLGFRLPGLGDLAYAIAGAIAMVVVVDIFGDLIATLLHRHDTETAIALMHQIKSPLETFLFVFLACAFAPFYEELSFRAFVFNALSRNPLRALARGRQRFDHSHGRHSAGLRGHGPRLRVREDEKLLGERVDARYVQFDRHRGVLRLSPAVGARCASR